MRLTELVREAWASARAQKIPTVMVAVLVAAMCVTTLLTVGRTAAAQTQVATRLDAAGSRELEVTDAKDLGFLTPSVVSLVAGLNTVERAVGVGPARDLTNAAIGAGGNKVSARTIVGTVADAVQVTAGRAPQPGEALVSQSAQQLLGMDQPVGALVAPDGTTIPVVGAFRPRAPFDDVNGVVVAASPADVAHTLDVVISSPEGAGVTEKVVLGVLARPDASDLSVDSPQTLAEIQASIAGDLGTFGRSLLLLVLGAGGLLVAIVVLADTLVRRIDLGRRRALGAPRWALVSLVIMRTTIAAVFGALLGTATVALIEDRSVHVFDWPFALGTATLAVLIASLAALPPAVLAAYQDPVRVLRTP